MPGGNSGSIFAHSSSGIRNQTGVVVRSIRSPTATPPGIARGIGSSAYRDRLLIRFNPAQFPTGAELSLAHTATGQVRSTLRAGRETLDLSRVTAVWYRRPDPPVAHEQIADATIRTFVEDECSSFMQDTLQMLRCLWVPAQPAVDQVAHLKAAQLELAGKLGFELPPTLITTSPAEFLAFYREHNGNVVSKLACGAFFGSLIKTYTRYTEVVSKRDLGYAQALRFFPVIFQAYVPKQIVLRITVVGRRVFAAEIHSPASNHTRP